MNRGVGEIEATQRFVPEGLYPVFEATTRLGDISVLVAVTVVAALILERDRACSVFGVVVGGFALLSGLKATFALGRPPSELHLIDTATTGFPSGHALGATVVYGALALSLTVGTRRARFAAAFAIVAGVSVSRVVLGVHYLLDIVVGAAVAAGYLWAMDRYARPDPGRTLAVAASIGLLAVAAGVVFGPTPRTACVDAVCLDRDTATWAAAGIGGVAAWYAGDRPFASAGRATAILMPLGLVGGGTLLWADSTLLADVVTAALGAAGVVVLADRGGSVRRLLP